MSSKQAQAPTSIGDKTPATVIVVGAGPAGCMLALLLADQGAHVSIFDSRHDTRDHRDPTTTAPASVKADQRSINLALSTRGLTALRRVGLDEQVMRHAVPMHARCVHSAPSSSSGPSPSPNVELHPYGQKDQFLLSVSRMLLSHVLQDAADRHPRVKLAFRHKCVDVDLSAPSITVSVSDGANGNVKEETVHADMVVGADGTYSKIRSAMARLPMFNFSQEYIPCCYKELQFVPPVHPNTSSTTVSSSHPLAHYPNALHIWPRHDFMLIALPNHHGDDNEDMDDKNSTTQSAAAAASVSVDLPKTSVVHSFTATLFMKPEQFAVLEEGGEDVIKSFFHSYFPDALPSLPSLCEDFRQNPTAPLVTMRCKPLSQGGRVVLIGDAAHAIVPFYGQGCNAAMEDTVVLSDIISSAGWNNLEQALQQYSTLRKPDVDAIADLAIHHFHDMSSRSASTWHVLKRRLEITLNKIMPSYFQPLYTLVSFSNVPYAQAVEKAAAQDRLLSNAVVATAASTVVASISIAAAYFFKYGRRNGAVPSS